MRGSGCASVPARRTGHGRGLRRLRRAAACWTTVLGYRREAYGGGPYLALVPHDGQGMELLLQHTDDRKAGKHGVHLDLRTEDLDVEVSRVPAVGGVMLTPEPVVEGGWRWHVWGTRTATNSACRSHPWTDVILP